MCPVVTEEKLLQSGWMKVKNSKVTSCTTLYVKIGEFSAVHLCSAQTHRLDQGTAFPHVYDRNTCYQKSISCCQLLIWGSAWRLTLYCRRCRRPFRCISFAFGSLKLHSHNLQWKRMTLPSSLRTWKKKATHYTPSLNSCIVPKYVPVCSNSLLQHSHDQQAEHHSAVQQGMMWKDLECHSWVPGTLKRLRQA